MSLITEPKIIQQPLPHYYGVGRPDNLKPVLLVMHMQEGYGNPWTWFANLPPNGLYAAACTIWNPRDDAANLSRFLRDEDVVWSNGRCRYPINRDNPVLVNLIRQCIYSGDVALTIEHEGFASEGITEIQLQRTIAMCAYWCQFWNIPPDRDHIIGHSDIGSHKYCPGKLFPFDRLIEGVRNELGLPTARATSFPNFGSITLGEGL